MINKCLCIKNGYMLSGKQFCKINDVYKYKDCYNEDYYYVNTINNKGHRMSGDFFRDYFCIDLKFMNSYMKEFRSGDFEIR